MQLLSSFIPFETAMMQSAISIAIFSRSNGRVVTQTQLFPFPRPRGFQRMLVITNRDAVELLGKNAAKCACQIIGNGRYPHRSVHR